MTISKEMDFFLSELAGLLERYNARLDAYPLNDGTAALQLLVDDEDVTFMDEGEINCSDIRKRLLDGDQ